MNSDRTVVVASLIWLGALVALSRQWVGDVRAYIVNATRGVSVPKTPAAQPTTRPRSGFEPDAGAGGGGGGGGGGSW